MNRARPASGRIREYLRRLEDENYEENMGRPPERVLVALNQITSLNQQIDIALRRIGYGDADAELMTALLDADHRRQQLMRIVGSWWAAHGRVYLNLKERA